MAILVTGGAGYIGSHTSVELLKAGYDVIIVDNLVNSKYEAVRRIEFITGRKLKFYQGDLLNRNVLNRIFDNEQIEAVVHCAGLKAVGESVRKPLLYYNTNIIGTLNLCSVMMKYRIKNIIFSSSATVYGRPEIMPITEVCPIGEIKNPYGQTKYILEQLLMDLYTADSEWNIVLLRYFNPIGAHESGLLGEDPIGKPNNLLPHISRVAIGREKRVEIFGDDYPTPDGTCIRDYVHITDLAKGHVKALTQMKPGSGVNIYNLGTGIGYSVLEVLTMYEKICGKELPYVVKPRREGDVAISYCDPSKAGKELGWIAEKKIEDMCMDSWKWQTMNPNGYENNL